jgi:hypothetical protein
LKYVVDSAMEKVSVSVDEEITVDDIRPGGRLDKRVFWWQITHDTKTHRPNLVSLTLSKMYQEGCFPLISKFLGGAINV